MNVIQGYPPNYAAICAVFPAVKSISSVMFAYDQTIYNPSGRPITGDLAVHENTHFGQQEAVGGPEAWWDRYLSDPQFRLEQEIEAYAVQYTYICLHNDRATRRKMLPKIAKDLSGPMYGNLITKDQAIAAILGHS